MYMNIYIMYMKLVVTYLVYHSDLKVISCSPYHVQSSEALLGALCLY